MGKHQVGDLVLGFDWDENFEVKQQFIGILSKIDKSKKPHRYHVEWADGSKSLEGYSRETIEAFRRNYLKYAKSQSR